MILGSKIWGTAAVFVYSKYGETGFREGEACGNPLKPYTRQYLLVTLNFFTNKCFDIWAFSVVSVCQDDTSR